MPEADPVKLTPKQIDEKCITEGLPTRHAGWEELPDVTADGVWPLSLAVLFYAWRNLVHTREQGERLRIWGRDIWRDPIDDRQFMPLDRAEAFLRSDLSSGIVRAFGYKEGADGPEYTKGPIPHEVWDQVQFGMRFDLGVVGNSDRAIYSGVTVLRHEVVPLLITETKSATAESEVRNRSDEPVLKRPGGAPEKYDWEGMWIEIVRLARDGELPSRAKLPARLATWFQDVGGDEPGLSTIRAKVKRLFDTIGIQ